MLRNELSVIHGNGHRSCSLNLFWLSDGNNSEFLNDSKIRKKLHEICDVSSGQHTWARIRLQNERVRPFCQKQDS